MPSKHTVVVSLDVETEQILKNLGDGRNRSAWIREAIIWRHTSDVEVLQALCDARSRKIEHLLRTIRKVGYMMDVGTIQCHGRMAEKAYEELKGLYY